MRKRLRGWVRGEARFLVPLAPSSKAHRADEGHAAIKKKGPELAAKSDDGGGRALPTAPLRIAHKQRKRNAASAAQLESRRVSRERNHECNQRDPTGSCARKGKGAP